MRTTGQTAGSNYARGRKSCGGKWLSRVLAGLRPTVMAFIKFYCEWHTKSEDGRCSGIAKKQHRGVRALTGQHDGVPRVHQSVRTYAVRWAVRFL
eukprot:501985-Pelagomonas_calceolata.AAC.1